MIEESIEKSDEVKDRDKSHKQRLKAKQKHRKQGQVNDILTNCCKVFQNSSDNHSFEKIFTPLTIRNDVQHFECNSL